MTNEKVNLRMDWGQVAMNSGPPCFHVDHESPNRYCGRAQRWAGHDCDHKFVSLDDLLTTAGKEEREAAFKEAVRLIGDLLPTSAGAGNFKELAIKTLNAAFTEK